MRFFTIAAAVMCMANPGFFGCDARSVGSGNNNANENVNQNTNTNENTQPPERLTRRILLQHLVNEVMGFQLDYGPDCPAANYYEDVGVEGVDEYLCRAIHLAVEMGVDTGSGVPNRFEPEREVNQAEAWKMITRLVGFVPWEFGDCADFLADEWYRPFFGTVCDKGLVPVVPEPAEPLTMNEWYSYTADLRAYMQEPVTRLKFSELLLGTHHDLIIPIEDCVSQYEDVEDSTFECVISTWMLDLGLLDPAQVNFRPEEPMTWPEVMKLTAVMVGMPEVQNSDCTELCTESHWGCGWANAWCEAGLLPEGIDDLNLVPKTGEAAHFIYMSDIHMN
jgi:hypothetical protein